MLADALVPRYISVLPKDPVNGSQYPLGATSTSFSYYSNITTESAWCNAAPRQTFRLTCRLESKPQVDKVSSACSTAPNSLYSAVSEHIGIK